MVKNSYIVEKLILIAQKKGLLHWSKHKKNGFNGPTIYTVKGAIFLSFFFYPFFRCQNFWHQTLPVSFALHSVDHIIMWTHHEGGQLTKPDFFVNVNYCSEPSNGSLFFFSKRLHLCLLRSLQNHLFSKLSFIPNS